MKVENGMCIGRRRRVQRPRGQIAHLDDRSRWSDLIHAAPEPIGGTKLQGTGVLIRRARNIAIDVP